MSCVIKSCKLLKRLMPSGSNISFHGFPRNEEMYQMWLRAIGAHKSTPWRKSLLICSKHFKPEDILVRGSDGRRFVKVHSVPSLHLFDDNVAQEPVKTSQQIETDTDNKNLQMPQKRLPKLPKKKLPKLPQKMPPKQPQKISPNRSQKMPPKMPQKMPPKMPQKMPQKLPKKMPKNIPQKITQKTSPKRTRKPKKLKRKQKLTVKFDIENWNYCKKCRLGHLLKKKDDKYMSKYLTEKKKLYRAYVRANLMTRKLKELKMNIRKMEIHYDISKYKLEQFLETNGLIPRRKMRKMQYTESVLKFAIKFNHHLPRAYQYFQDTFNSMLPRLISNRKKF